MTEGFFEIIPEDDGWFNLQPKDDTDDAIPEDQRDLSRGIYGAVGVLKLLKEQHVFDEDATTLTEFRTRLEEVAKAGLTGPHVRSRLAATALEQIRDEIVLRRGRKIKFQFLVVLLRWAGLGVVAGAVIAVLAGYGSPIPPGYGWVIVGSMVGAWLSVAARRREIAIEDMPYFLDSKVEPGLRMLFVGLLAATLALFLELGVLSIRVADVDLATFQDSAGVALLLGVVAGIGEKAISVRLIRRASEVAGPA